MIEQKPSITTSQSSKSDVVLCCPECKNTLGNLSAIPVECSNCGFNICRYEDIPVLRAKAKNENEDAIDLRGNSNNLSARNTANLPIPFVQKALNSGGLTLELGAGVDNCELQNLVKTDAYLYSNNLDLIVDAHNLPFLDNTFDYVFSLAVFEHLHTPWLAAQEIYRVLKPGGQVFCLTAFNQHIHGYPDHYFNMTDSGLRRIFSEYEILEYGPSKHCSLKLIARSLIDLIDMVKNLKSEYHLNSESTDKVNQSKLDEINTLESALRQTVQLIPKFSDDLISVKKSFEQWRAIAPAVEIIASKPYD